MISIRRLLLLIVLFAGVGGAIGVIVSPELATQAQELVDPIIADLNLIIFGLLIATLFVLLAVARLFRGSTTNSSRPVITTTSPETVVRTFPQSTDQLDQRVEAAFQAMESPSQVDRLVAIYGQRATVRGQPSQPVTRVLEELSKTAERSYMTAHGVDRETATTAVSEGTWCDCPMASTFLATETDPPAEFSLVQRILAWLFPRRTFRRRIERTLDAIDSLTDSYGVIDARQIDDRKQPERSTQQLEGSQ